MNPVTHLLASWSVAGAARQRDRDLALATWCGVLPDIDGLGVVVDEFNELTGRPESWYFGEYHHALLHGLFGATVISLSLSLFARRRLRTFLVGFGVAHLHFLCDVVGSRGPDADDIWPIRYLAPFSERLTIRWSGQWALNAWPNILLTAVLLAFVFYRAAGDGYSPVGMFSVRADHIFVETVRARWRRLTTRTK